MTITPLRKSGKNIYQALAEEAKAAKGEWFLMRTAPTQAAAATAVSQIRWHKNSYTAFQGPGWEAEWDKGSDDPERPFRILVRYVGGGRKKAAK